MIFDSNKIFVLKFLSGSDKKKKFIIIFLFDNELLVSGICLRIVHQCAAIVVSTGSGRIGAIRLRLRLL